MVVFSCMPLLVLTFNVVPTSRTRISNASYLTSPYTILAGFFLSIFVIDRLSTLLGFLNRLSSAVSKGPPASLIVMGDFNAKHKQWSSAQPNSAGNCLYALMEYFFLTQYVTEPTQYSENFQLSNTLDLLATNKQDLLGEISVSDPVSDFCRVAGRLFPFSPTQA